MKTCLSNGLCQHDLVPDGRRDKSAEFIVHDKKSGPMVNKIGLGRVEEMTNQRRS